jgi:hypothetical protein
VLCCCLPAAVPQGVITSGPYAFLRHPAYLCKNITWWLIAVPWSTHDGVEMAFKRCVRLGMINLVYYTRAKTEEAHLLRDQAYVDYWNALQRRYGLSGRVLLAQQQPQQQQIQQQYGDAEEQRPLKLTVGGHEGRDYPHGP